MIKRADIKQTIDQLNDVELAHHYDSFVMTAAIKTLETCGNEIAELRAKLAEAEKARYELACELQNCAEVFRRYESIHLLKCSDDGNEKAHSNRHLAIRCEAALAAMKEQP